MSRRELESMATGIGLRAEERAGELIDALKARRTYKDGVAKRRTVQSEIATTLWLWLFAFGLRPEG